MIDEVDVEFVRAAVDDEEAARAQVRGEFACVVVLGQANTHEA